MIVKDNFETPTCHDGGSLSLQGDDPKQDAFMVRRIREAGAIVLAKSNMAEFAFTPVRDGELHPAGYTKNPYALDRVTAGSSGGSAAAVPRTSASCAGHRHRQLRFAVRRAPVARGHSLDDGADEPRWRGAAQSGVGYRGPMARTVADAVAIFQVVAGEDAPTA
jgi:Asp-tRNA(Asn)/Glu-tRNA(Gln) amidotransferase A subunit family amidase